MFKVKPWFIRMLVPSYTWVTIGNTIFTPVGVNPSDPRWKAVIAHENVHRLRQSAAGTWIWLFKYICCRSFRLDEEARAISAEYENTPNDHKSALLASYAEDLSSSYYFWAASCKAEAMVALMKYITL